MKVFICSGVADLTAEYAFAAETTARLLRSEQHYNAEIKTEIEIRSIQS